ncbi:MAG: mannitol dehydrogenase-like protein [Naasia sp.]|jgi:mannitol 2-dehydrogenase|uniref:mannitol dehydrogenase family protein n=1 Tax=Naasia sp. TaxID=2546198 RepID=UPI0026071DA1|nr:mannitol dehydrogenase family protein [Naasia sp.]MCU1569955.1 mannitol dehydrogenase-like protein [Naasia sp.]
MQLSASTIGSLPVDVAVPGYDRSSVTVGIVHFGVGGFHRSHQAMFVDRLMNRGEALDWGICGVGAMHQDAGIRDVMDAQDCLYTLELKHPDGSRDLRVIGSIVQFLFAPDDPDAVIERMADPAVRIVSLTITEGGYNFDQVTGEFDVTNPAVLKDAALTSPPATVFGLVVEALARRRERGIEPFTVMSCDNIQGNGEVARRSFSAYARLRSPELGDWVESSVAFPNSMVDRITPVTTDDDRAEIADRLGVTDAWPVVAEPFEQWALEDHFPLGRPAFERVGVQVVEDVEPYELMKLRLLNATHQGMCYLGYLAGYRYAHEASADPAIAQFLLDYMDFEATPTLRPVPGVDLAGYKRMLIERYRNPEVRDTLARLCAESSDRIPKWLLPVVREQLATGGPVRNSAAIVASWARYVEGVDDQGAPITVVDRLRDELVPLAQSQRENILAFLQNRSLFGDLAENDRFTTEYRAALESLFENGAQATVEAYAGFSPRVAS